MAKKSNGNMTNENMRPKVASPTWGQVQYTAEKVLEALGGPQGASQKLDGNAFFTLAVLASMDVDEPAVATAPIFG